MKTFWRFLGGLSTAALLLVCFSVVSRADDERAGYQGIPVRNGFNRAAVQQDDSSRTRRYPRLARRPNEVDQAPADAESPSGEHAGYGGIPQRVSATSPMRPNRKTVKPERAGYRGVPQPANHNEQKANSPFSGGQSSPLANPK